MKKYFLTSGDAAREIKKSRDTILRYVKAGKLNPTATLGRGGRVEVLFDQREIDRFLSAQREANR